MAKSSGLNFNLPSVDDLFSTEEERAEAQLEKVKFTVVMPDGTTYTERQDIGDGDGGVLDFLAQYPKYQDILPLLQQSTPPQNDYMLLSRLKADCDYFLGAGGRAEKHLWAGNVREQIAKMRELYDALPEKPEWLTMEDMRNFGEDYSMENIRRRILAQRRPLREHRPEPFRCRLHGDLKQAKKVTGFRALYFHYCYLLGVFPQKQNRPPRRVPHTLREDLIRAQELTDEARLLSRHRIDTLEQLNAYRSDVESQLAGLTEQRKSLYRKLRTKAVLADPAQQEHIRAEISKLSVQIKELRREVKLCGDIALRSTSIKDKIQAAREEVSGRDEKARQEPEQGRAAPPGRR